MIMGRSPFVVIIDIVNVLRAILKSKDYAPVCPDGHGPKALHSAFERMQPQLRLVDVSNGWGGMECRQNIPQIFGMFRVYTPWVIVFKELSQPLVANRPNQISP